MLNFTSYLPLALIFTGFLAGFVDSIAGGGGLISLPVLTLLFGAGAEAIGTNKIVGAVAAVVAFFVYLRTTRIELKRSFAFVFWVGFGSYAGSLVTPLLPKEVFHWILLGTCPLILWIVLNKNIWINRSVDTSVQVPPKWFGLADFRVFISGLVCGFYDGAWGPGAGTFILLALIFVVRLPLMGALITSKLANSCSAIVALTSYALRGYVHWREGFCIACGIAVGAFFGATAASKNASKIVRPVLVIVVVLLMVRLLS